VGDINASVKRAKENDNDKRFLQFCKDNGLYVHPLQPDLPTFYHFNGISCSQIDYAVTHKNQADVISKVMIDVRNPANVGPHDAIVVHTPLGLKEVEPVNNAQSPSKEFPRKRTNWQKVDKPQYEEETDRKLAALEECITDHTPAAILLTRINQILVDCSTAAQPTAKVKPKKHRKSKWNRQLKPYLDASKEAFWKWKQAGHIKDDSCPVYMEMKLAKALLRKAQRISAAKDRTALYTEIMETNIDTNKQMFYKLISKQRKLPFRVAAIDFPDYATGSNDAEKWASFFSDLATPNNLPEFDDVHKASMLFLRLLISTLPPDEKPLTITEEQVARYTSSLRNNKAADAAGVTSEHIKYASKRLVTIVTILINRIFKKRSLPEELKAGLATLIPKKALTQTDPDKFRRITITSLIGKLLEKHLVTLASEELDSRQSPLQFGFTKGVPCNTASLLLTESIAHHKDVNSNLYTVYMDASKAFDVVDHDCALNHLYRQGVKGDLWTLYNDLYTGITSSIKWCGTLSRPFTENQGIRQGAVSSTSIFKARANPSLHQMEDHPGGARIGSINLGPIMVADDLCLTSTTIQGAQSLVSEAESDAARERFSFSKTKTRLVVANQKQDDNVIYLNGSRLEQSTAETHLGIIRTSDGKNSKTIEARIQSARRTAYSLTGAGYHGLNGVGPEIGKQLWNIYIQPRLLYSLETLILAMKDISELESFQRVQLRLMQHLPKSTATPALYLLLGIPPIEAQLDITTLVYFVDIMRRSDSVERAVIERQLVMKSPDSNSWPWYVYNKLKKYNLPSAFSLLKSQPSKPKWRRMVKAAVLTYWENRLKHDATKMSSMGYVNLAICNLSSAHPVWRLGAASSLTVIKATTKAKLLLQRYPLFTNRTAGVNYGNKCPLCKDGQESMAHFLVACPTLEPARQPLMRKFLDILCYACLKVPDSEESLVRAILDPSCLCSAEAHTDIVNLLEATTRDLCFSLHHRRSTQLGYSSRFKQNSQHSGNLLRAQCGS
jgi:hypothetical protein